MPKLLWERNNKEQKSMELKIGKTIGKMKPKCFLKKKPDKLLARLPKIKWGKTQTINIRDEIGFFTTVSIVIL